MSYISIHKKYNLSILLVLCLLGLALISPANANDLENQIKQAQEKINAQNEEIEKEKNSNITDAPIVIELFTAPDCSACIYADRLLYDATQKENVIGLSCYINPNSEDIGIDQCIFRQWAYISGDRGNYRTLNTPEFIFGGDKKVSSGNLSEFDLTIKKKRSKYNNDALNVFIEWKDEDTLNVHLPQQNKSKEKDINSSVYLIRYNDMMVEKSEIGVNVGRVLRFSNVIQNIKHIGKWHGSQRVIEVDVSKPLGGKEKGGYAVLLQEYLGGSILGAGKVSDYQISNALAPSTQTKKVDSSQ